MILETVYSQTVNGEEKYFMNFIMPSDGSRVTYDVDEYFSELVIEPPTSLEENVNSLESNNTSADGNTIANDTTETNEQVNGNSTDENTVANNDANNNTQVNNE